MDPAVCSGRYNDSEFSAAYDLMRLGKRCEFNQKTRRYSTAGCTTRSHISPCTPSEFAHFKMSPVLPLRWDDLPRGGMERYIWKVYENLAGQRLFVCGDSMGEQIYVALFLYLRSIGIRCMKTHYQNTTYYIEFTCPNDFEVVQRNCRMKKEFIYSVNEEMKVVTAATNRFYLVNNGLWYNERNINSYIIDSKEVFSLLSNVSMKSDTTKVGWWYTTHQHFPGGQSYDEYATQLKHRHISPTGQACAAHKAHYSTEKFENVQSSAVELSKGKIHIISFRNFTFSRHDAHTHYAMHKVANLLDCTHYCMQPCFFEPIIFEIAKFLESSVK
jgi:hypothetical protein